MIQKTTIVNNIKYIIKNENDIIQNTILNGNQWNNDIVLLIGYWIKKFKLDHFVNIGCHIGTVALPISKYIKKVTAIEPFPPSYKHFMEHIKLNDIKNIDSFNLAVGDKECQVYFLDPESERIKNNSGGIHAVTEDDTGNNGENADQAFNVNLINHRNRKGLTALIIASQKGNTEFVRKLLHANGLKVNESSIVF